MYCKHCGKEVNDNAAFCIHCGVQLTGVPAAHAGSGNANNPNDFEDSANTGLAILSFFIPLVGLILYLIYEKSKPNLAKSVGKGALIGFIARVALYIIGTILYIVLNIAAFGGLIYMIGSL